MEKLKNSVLSHMMTALALMASLAFVACSSDDEDDNGNGNAGTKEARSLQVTIDESGLTYEDLTIHLTTGADYVYKNAPFGTVKVTIDDLPSSVDELKKLRLPAGISSIHQSPYLQPMLIVAALNQLNYDKTEARRMVDYIAKEAKSENRNGETIHMPGGGVTSAYAAEWSQVEQYKKFDKVRSYLEGADHSNGYLPSKKPYVMRMEITNNSYTADKDVVQLWLTSTQASSKRQLPIWKYDSDGDGTYDVFWTSNYRTLLHGLAEY